MPRAGLSARRSCPSQWESVPLACLVLTPEGRGARAQTELCSSLCPCLSTVASRGIDTAVSPEPPWMEVQAVSKPGKLEANNITVSQPRRTWTQCPSEASIREPQTVSQVYHPDLT